MATSTATPTTFTSTTLTSAQMNQNVRDPQLAFGATATYTPTVTGFTSVVVTATGQWMQIQKSVHVRLSVTLGTVTTLGASTISVSLPVQASATQGTNRFMCGIFRNNAGVHVPAGILITNNATTFTVFAQTPGGANPNLLGWTGAVPAGQVAGDAWSFEFWYEAA